jgi:hypothetical protein
MNSSTTNDTGRTHRQAGFAVTGILVLLGLVLGGHFVAMRAGHPKPPADQFGFGPRASTETRYVATLTPDRPLKARTMHTLQVSLTDADGAPIDGARIDVGGGMPQHGHGLPTHPRVTRELGQGVYEIDGVRFNMGGWWEFRLSITTPAGSDVVTFNLAI